MTAPLALLNYAGPQPTPQPSLIARCCRAAVWLVMATLFVALLTVRAVLLIAGFACMFAGLVLLTLGGKRDAARKLMLWRERFVDLCRLWADDILSVVRRRRHGRGRGRAPQPQAVLPLAGVTSR
jgi:hypothetical protein